MTIMKDRDARYARDRIAEIEAGTPNRNARKRMAEIVLMRAKVGRYDDDALAVWREYLATFE